MTYKKRSGAQRKNRRIAKKRERLQQAGVVLNRVRIRHLRDAADWEIEVARLYRSALRGEIPAEDATKFAYVAKTGSDLARYREDRQYIRELIAKLDEARALGSRVSLLPLPTDDDPDPKEIPLNTGDDDDSDL